LPAGKSTLLSLRSHKLIWTNLKGFHGRGDIPPALETLFAVRCPAFLIIDFSAVPASTFHQRCKKAHSVKKLPLLADYNFSSY
jgi:hypothetical protein